MGSTYDFSGWATRNNVRCSDGRTIKKDAFIQNHGKTVPLVWNHQHNNPNDVLGHALLENREEGVYAYCSFNDTEMGRTTKQMVEHGDITSLSIYANQLRQKGSDVIHGAIREVSLVLAGANPEAFIVDVIRHSNECDGEAEMFFMQDIEMYHTEEKEEPKEEEEKEEAPKQEEPEKEEPEVAAEINHAEEKTVQDVIDGMTEEQKNVMYFVVGQALEDAGVKHTEDSEGGENIMKHNAFENEEVMNGSALSHDAIATIITDGKRFGTLKESVLQHADDYGIQGIDWLFPEFKNVDGNGAPQFIKRQPDDWVAVVMNGVHHTPFSRIKSMFADITEDDARAKGYIKGKRKKEEVFSLLKRTTDPQTVYKKQKLDRDDVSDITDFEVVSWIKAEMRMMLDEEIARAILVGDGRLSSSDDKIQESHIRPIYNDDNLFTIKKKVAPASGETFEHAFIQAAVKGQVTYQGSGNLTAFVEAGVVTDLLLMEDKNGIRLYKNVADVANAMNVNRIVKLPAGILPTGTYAVIVDLKDYNVGADKGGSINMFDDFDIDYNQMKYLIETRASGALIKPFAAIVLAANVEDEDPDTVSYQRSKVTTP